MAVVGYEQLTVAGVAVGFTTTNIGGVRPMAAVCTVETNPIRYRTDGADPTAAVGMLVNPGGTFRLGTRFEVKNFKAIRTGASGVVNAEFEL